MHSISTQPGMLEFWYPLCIVMVGLTQWKERNLPKIQLQTTGKLAEKPEYQTIIG